MAASRAPWRFESRGGVSTALVGWVRAREARVRRAKLPGTPPTRRACGRCPVEPGSGHSRVGRGEFAVGGLTCAAAPPGKRAATRSTGPAPSVVQRTRTTLRRVTEFFIF